MNEKLASILREMRDLDDEGLRALTEHARDEAKQRASQMGRAFKKGDRVRFNSATRPVYMQGELATVVRVTSSAKCVVILDNQVGRFAGAGEIKAPFMILERAGS